MVVSKWLDPEQIKTKPMYNMATSLPLVLQDCSYENIDLLHEPATMMNLFKHVETEWEKMAIRQAILFNQMEAIKHYKLRRSCIFEKVKENSKEIEKLALIQPGEDLL